MRDNTIIGKKIVDVREMTDKEMEREGWEHSRINPPSLVLNDGHILFPSCDGEGNAPGSLFGYYEKYIQHLTFEDSSITVFEDTGSNQYP